MKLIVAVILTALLAFAGGLYLPWWSVALAAFISASLIPMRSRNAFLSGFFGVFILWVLLAWLIDMKNQGILSKKVAEILPLGGSSFLLILITAIIGALVGGLGALTASYIRRTK